MSKLTGEYIDYYIRDEAHSNTLRDRVHKYHGYSSNVGREGLSNVCEVNLGETAYHQKANHNQSRCCSKGRNGQE